MTKIRAAVVGYGNIGRFSIEALEAAPDFEIAGVVRRNVAEIPAELAPYKVVTDIRELGHVDVAILATPTREVEKYALEYLAMGINTVDSFDIHTSIIGLRRSLDAAAKKTGRVAVISAGWDPGSDSIVRTLLEAAAPKGLTYTNFGPGMSMGHTVCVKSKAGVKNALSMTMPKGDGMHRRMVYVELEDGARLEDVAKAVKEDPYFASDETHVMAVESVDAVKDMGHGVHMVRKGVSGKTQNQRFEFNMSINNPALTAQLLVGVARASGAPVIAGALEYAAELVRGNWKKVSKEEFDAANKAGFREICAAAKKASAPKAASEEEVKMPPKEIATGAIPGIEVMDLEDAVKALWKENIYAESGMGCTGPIVLVPDAKLDAAQEILKKAGYIGG